MKTAQQVKKLWKWGLLGLLAALLVWPQSAPAQSCHPDSLGDWNYCRTNCKCGKDQGDCDGDSECKIGFYCKYNIGSTYGWSSGIDVCVSCPEYPEGHLNHCKGNCKCDSYKGDCDSDSECKPGMRCITDVGSWYGYSWYVDVCQKNGDWEFCRDTPCSKGQGDCDSNSECQAGLYCKHNIGADFGWNPIVDVCVQCRNNNDCHSPKSICHNHTCVECVSDNDCTTAGKTHCKTSSGTCVECLNNTHCAYQCNSHNQCIPPQHICPDYCNSHADCQSQACGNRTTCINNVCSALQTSSQCMKANLLIVLDKSGSMAWDGNKWNKAENAINDIVSSYHEKVRFGLELFNSGSFIPTVRGNCQIEATPIIIRDTLSYYGPGGGTNIIGAMNTAKQEIIRAIRADHQAGIYGRNSAIMFITDGQASCPSTQVSSLRNLNVDGHVYDVKTFVIGFGSGVDQNCLNKMANDGGTNRCDISGCSRYYVASNQSDMQAAMSAIVDITAAEKCDGLDNDCDGQVDEGNPEGICDCVKSYTRPTTTSLIHPTWANDKWTGKKISLYTFVSSFANQGDCSGNPDIKNYMKVCRNKPPPSTCTSGTTVNPPGNAWGIYCHRCCSTGGYTCNWPTDHPCQTLNLWASGYSGSCKNRCQQWCIDNRVAALNCLSPRGELKQYASGYNSNNELVAYDPEKPNNYTTDEDYKDFGVRLSKQTSRHLYVNASGADVRDPNFNGTTLLGTITPDNFDLPTSATSVNTSAYVWDTGNNYLTAADLGITNCSSQSACNVEKRFLIRFIRGEMVNKNNNVIKRSSPLGPIYHSTPVVMGPPRNVIDDPGYRAFINSNLPSKSNKKVSQRPAVLYVGTNDGIFHAFHVDTGYELWGFIPHAVLHKIRSTVNGEDDKGRRVYTVDGTPVVQNVQLYRYTDSSGTLHSEWKTVAIFGLRAGGKAYIALDVTDPYQPKILWEINNNSKQNPSKQGSGTFSNLAYTFAKPYIANVWLDCDAVSDAICGTGRQERAVVILSGGVGLQTYPSSSLLTMKTDAASEGGVVYVVDLKTGIALRQFEPKDPYNQKYPVTGTPAGFGLHPMLTSRVFVGDVKGRVFRIDLQDGDPSAWNIKLFYDTKTSQPIMTALAISMNPRGEIVLNGATGNLFHLGVYTGMNQLFSVREHIPATGGYNSNGSIDQVQVGMNYAIRLNKVLTNSGTTNEQEQTATSSNTASGTTDTGEKLTGSPFVFNNTLYFTTYMPSNSVPICGIPGNARYYNIDFEAVCRKTSCVDAFSYSNVNVVTGSTPIRCCETSTGTCDGSNQLSDTTRFGSDYFRLDLQNNTGNGYSSFLSLSLYSKPCADLSFTVPRFFLEDTSGNLYVYRYRSLGSNTMAMGSTLNYQAGEATINPIDSNDPSKGYLFEPNQSRPGVFYSSFQLAGRSYRNYTTQSQYQSGGIDFKLNKAKVLKPPASGSTGTVVPPVTVGMSAKNAPVKVTSWGAVLE